VQAEEEELGHSTEKFVTTAYKKQLEVNKIWEEEQKVSPETRNPTPRPQNAKCTALYLFSTSPGLSPCHSRLETCVC